MQFAQLFKLKLYNELNLTFATFLNSLFIKFVYGFSRWSLKFKLNGVFKDSVLNKTNKKYDSSVF